MKAKLIGFALAALVVGPPAQAATFVTSTSTIGGSITGGNGEAVDKCVIAPETCVDAREDYQLQDVNAAILANLDAQIQAIVDFLKKLSEAQLGSYDVRPDPVRPGAFSYSYLDRNNITRLGTVTITSPGAVPEPATWAMMMFGLGVTGAVVRRRRGDTPRMHAA